MIVGIACPAGLQRPDQVRKFCLERERETDDHAADVRHRQALEPPDDRGGERVDDQQGQRLDADSVLSSSARKIPAIAAIDVPSIHENVETRARDARRSAPASSRLSTTARIATPSRVR